MSIQKLLGTSWGNRVSNHGNAVYRDNNFVKNTFNFGNANPDKPNGIVYENALGDPPKGTRLYCLG